MKTIDGRGLIMLAGGLAILLMLAPAAASAPARQDTLLGYDTVVRGEITAASGEETWQFYGLAGDWILIDMRAAATGLDAALTLLGPDGSPLVTDDDGGVGLNARIGPLELPAAGEYTIVARQYSGAGEYTLDLRNLRTVPALAPGKPLLGNVDGDHPNDVFALDLPAGAAAGTLWRLDISEADYLGPILTLYGPEGPITSTEIQPGATTIDPIIPVPGEAYIVVVTWAGSGPGGGYEIVLQPSALELLADGASQAGMLDALTPFQIHYFRAEEGQVVRISARTRDAIAPTLEVFSVDHSAYLFSSEARHTRGIQITLAVPVTAVYAITVRDGSFSGNRGSYTLDYEVVAE